MEKALARYASEVAVLAEAEGTREETYYPAIRALLASILSAQDLPLDVRATVGAERPGGGSDVPDIALYDSGGEFLAACGEVKRPTVELAEMARSTERNDPIGRYLARTRVVLLCNIRGFGLVVAKPGAAPGPVAPDMRRLEQEVELWPSFAALKQGRPLRWLYYDVEANLLNRRRPELWNNLPENTFLIGVPQSRRASEARPLTAECLFDLHLHDRGSAAFSAFVTPEQKVYSTGREKRRANLAEPVWSALKKHWSLKGDLTGEAAGKLTLRLFHLALAVGHAPAYHADHQEALAQDWLHLPIPRDRKRLEQAAGLGAAVAALLDPQKDATRAVRAILGGAARSLGVLSVREADHVADSELLVEYSFYGAAAGAWKDRPPAADEPHRACWGEVTGDLYVNPRVYFRHVPQRAWELELGGYPVLKKWLGYREAKRRGRRPLTLDEANHFRSMIQRLAALLVLQDKLDTAYAAVIEDCFTRQELGLS